MSVELKFEPLQHLRVELNTRSKLRSALVRLRSYSVISSLFARSNLKIKTLKNSKLQREVLEIAPVLSMFLSYQ